MKITILGSGTFVPELNRHCSSYLVEVGKEKIILDLGRGAIDNLLKLKVNLLDLDRIFISHMHTDHATELATLIQLFLDSPDKKKLKEKYTIYGPKGIRKNIKKLLEAFHIDKHKNLKRIKIKELSPNEIIKIGKLKASGFKTQHGKGLFDCFGYILKYKNKKICYSGDSGFSKDLIKFFKNSDLAIIEATGPREWWYHKDHMDGEEAGEIASKARVKNLIVTHTANSYLPEVKKDIKKTYKGKFSIAKDLMEIRI